MIFEKVAAMIAEQLSVPQSKVTREARLLEDLKADSANVMMLILDLETEFGLAVEDDVLANMRTVNDIVTYLEKNA
ncbi:MAG: acyl carrier protein [Clostridiales bacterium]|nr:acyl carrier protein [Clostridiales bacterium]